MRRRHFEALRPVCPLCRTATGSEFELRLAQVKLEEANHIVEGVLHCSNPVCQREYPIIDGIPIIVPELRRYIADNIGAITTRTDLGAEAESMLGDCCGPDSVFNQTRQYLSSYTWDHYGDLDPKETAGPISPGSMLRSLRAGMTLAPKLLAGPRLDAGCSVGRSTFALAENTDELVLGIDLNFAMLRVATRALRSGIVRYPRRRVGLVYDRREFAVSFPQAERVDFWACDAAALPFASETFATTLSLNVLDCVPSPKDFLVSLARTLRTGGQAILTCPYDWSSAATPLESWLGGHSQRSPLEGSAEGVLRLLLTPQAHPASINSLRLAKEQDDIPWHVRLHDRSTMTYRLHLVVAEKIAAHTS